MEKVDKSNLAYMGQDFQYAAAKMLIEDQRLFRDLYKILDQNCFSDPVIRKIIGTEKDMYAKNKIVPSYSEIEMRIRSKEIDAIEVEYVEETIDKLKRTSSSGYVYIKEELINFFKWKYAILVFNKGLEKLKDVYDETAFKKVLKDVVILTNPEENYQEIKFTKENVIKVLTEGEEEVIPTGINEVDKRIAGGLGRTEIGLFTALTGYGKTTFGSVIAHNAAVNGYKVLQIYFEDKQTDMLRKQLSIIDSGVQINKLMGMTYESAEMYASKIVKENGFLKASENHILAKMENKETTVEDIEDLIEHLLNNEDFRPDMIVIDYFGCLKFSRNGAKDIYLAQADCMRKIKNLAFNYNVAIWIMQQNNRPSSDKTAGMGNWQGAYEATQPASVWIELQRTKEQKENGRADLIFNKTRHSQPKEDLLDIVFNNGTMTIDCTDTTEIELNEIYKYNDYESD